MVAAGIRQLFANLDDVTLDEAGAVAIDGVQPEVVVRPRSAAALVQLLQAAHPRGARAIARGGGTRLHVGNRPAGIDYLIDLTLLNAIEEYRPRDLTITAAAGTPIAVIQDTLAAEGQMLGLEPPLPRRATAGGTLAANAFGPRRFRYGTARDYVIGIGAVLADGTAIKSGGRVVKNVAGYDLAKLLIGSWGTLALITRVTFRVFPRPANTGVVVAALPDLATAHAAAMAVAGSALLPLTLDLLSPGALAELGPHADHWRLVAEAGGSPATYRRTRDELIQLCRAHGGLRIDTLDREDAAPLLAAVRDFSHDAPAPPLSLTISARPSRLAAAWQTAGAVVAARGMGLTGVARAGNGVLLGTVAGAIPDEAALLAELRATLAPLAAGVVVERCRPDTKAAVDVWGLTGSDRAIMRAVKHQYDPSGLFSPGRGPAGE